MADPERVSPEEARDLIASGYTYVDVRTEAEFERGHPPGAFNVPLQSKGVPNPDFLAVMEAAFGKDRKLLLGCQTGVRSLKAVKLLVPAGFTDVKELRTGFDGARDAFGRLEAGWSKVGLPVETGAPPGHGYADLRAKLG